MSVLPYRKSGLSHHRDEGQQVYFPEARDPATGACVIHREEMMTGQYKNFG
jgi:hypothetical protein